MPGGMYDFAAVSPPGSSVVLTFGGVDSGTGRHRDGIDLYDRYERGQVWAEAQAATPWAAAVLQLAC